MSKLPSDLSTVTTELPRNHRDNCVIPEIAFEDGGSGQHLLGAFASLCEIILALGFDRAWPRDGANRRVPPQSASHGPAVAPQRLRLPRAGEELFRTTVTVH
jgi:hypothetical protein